MMILFTIGAQIQIERKARESNPHLRLENRLSRAARPNRIRLPSKRGRGIRGEGRDDLSFLAPRPSRLDPPGIEPESPVCRTGVVPLDHEPIWTEPDAQAR